jgi:hypothetical protein
VATWNWGWRCGVPRDGWSGEKRDARQLNGSHRLRGTKPLTASLKDSRVLGRTSWRKRAMFCFWNRQGRPNVQTREMGARGRRGAVTEMAMGPPASRYYTDAESARHLSGSKLGCRRPAGSRSERPRVGSRSIRRDDPRRGQAGVGSLGMGPWEFGLFVTSIV